MQRQIMSKRQLQQQHPQAIGTRAGGGRAAAAAAAHHIVQLDAILEAQLLKLLLGCKVAMRGGGRR